jgi:hypothetical protein
MAGLRHFLANGTMVNNIVALPFYTMQNTVN